MHAVGGLTADADVGAVAGVAFAHDAAFAVDQIAIDGKSVQGSEGVLDVEGVGADLGSGGVQTAGFNDAVTPLSAVDVERDQRADGDGRLGGGEVLCGGWGLEALQCCLLGAVGAQGVLLGLVGGVPQAVANRLGIVVGRG